MKSKILRVRVRADKRTYYPADESALRDLLAVKCADVSPEQIQATIVAAQLFGVSLYVGNPALGVILTYQGYNGSGAMWDSIGESYYDMIMNGFANSDCDIMRGDGTIESELFLPESGSDGGARWLDVLWYENESSENSFYVYSFGVGQRPLGYFMDYPTTGGHNFEPVFDAQTIARFRADSDENVALFSED